jgi:hypothetical protein
MIFQVGIQVYPPPGPQGVWWQIGGPNKQNVARSDSFRNIEVFHHIIERGFIRFIPETAGDKYTKKEVSNCAYTV